MRVWVVKIGEPLPSDGPRVRLLRTGVLAASLAERGMDVTWWTAAFSHESKQHRCPAHRTLKLGPRLSLKLLHSSGYVRNVSLRRIRDHAQVARAFAELAPAEPPPDVIVSSLPTPGLCAAVADFAQPRGLPWLADLRDRWPDVFLDLLPPLLRGAGRLALGSLFRQTAEVCRRATGLVGVTETYLRWGLEYAGRPRGACDAVLPIGYRRQSYPEDVLGEARRYWDQAGVPADPRVLTACFFGTLGRQFALDPVIEAARILGRQGLAARFVLCGTGDFAARFRRQARDLPNVLFPGRIDGPQIQVLMERSQLGLAPYRGTANFAGHIPNKPAEYLSAGLPVVSTLCGDLAELLASHQCGWTYDSGDARRLAEILGRLPADAGQRAALSANARRLFAQRFNAEEIYAAYARHLEFVAGREARPRRAA